MMQYDHKELGYIWDILPHTLTLAAVSQVAQAGMGSVSTSKKKDHS